MQPVLFVIVSVCKMTDAVHLTDAPPRLTIPVGTGNTIMNTPTIKGSRKIGLIRNGLNAIIKRWLENDCHETPEQMCEILLCEYRGRFDSAGRR